MLVKITRWAFACALIALGSYGARAQQIQGQVRYADTNQPAINITVRCDGIGGDTFQMTDASGKFFFRVSPGHYTVTVHIPGYREEQQSADLTDNNSNEYFFIKLKPDGTPKTGGGAAPAGGAAGVPEAAQKEFEAGRVAILGEGGQKADVPGGIKHLEKAVSLHPKYLEAQMMIGTAYMDEKQWDKAEAALRKAVEINPKATTAWIALGEALRREKKYDDAQKALGEAVKLDDKSAQAHFGLGEVYWEKNDLPNAGVQVGTALQIKPDYAEAHLLAGNILLRARKAEEALAEFQEYLRLAPDGPFAQQARDISQKIKDALAKKQ